MADHQSVWEKVENYFSSLSEEKNKLILDFIPGDANNNLNILMNKLLTDNIPKFCHPNKINSIRTLLKIIECAPEVDESLTIYRGLKLGTKLPKFGDVCEYENFTLLTREISRENNFGGIQSYEEEKEEERPLSRSKSLVSSKLVEQRIIISSIIDVPNKSIIRSIKGRINSMDVKLSINPSAPPTPPTPPTPPRVTFSEDTHEKVGLARQASLSRLDFISNRKRQIGQMNSISEVEEKTKINTSIIPPEIDDLEFILQISIPAGNFSILLVLDVVHQGVILPPGELMCTGIGKKLIEDKLIPVVFMVYSPFYTNRLLIDCISNALNKIVRF